MEKTHWHCEEEWKHTMVVWWCLWDRPSKVSCHCTTGFGAPGASCHCSVHLRLMAYREGGNGIVREVDEDREGLRLHPVTEPDHLSVRVHVWGSVQLEDNEPTASNSYCWRLFLQLHPAYLTNSAHCLEPKRQAVLSLTECFIQGSSASSLKALQQGHKFQNR